MVEQPLRVRLAERLEQERARVGETATPAGPLVEQLRTRQADDEHRHATRRPHDVLDEVEERRLRPVDVVQDEHERARAGEPLENRARALEQLGRRGRPVDVLGRGRGHLVERKIRDALAVRKTACAEVGGTLLDVLDQLLHEPGLADAGNAEDREQPARPLLHRRVERGMQRGHLAGAPDQGRVEPQRATVRSREQLDEAQRGLRLRRLERCHLRTAPRSPSSSRIWPARAARASSRARPTARPVGSASPPTRTSPAATPVRGSRYTPWPARARRSAPRRPRAPRRRRGRRAARRPRARPGCRTPRPRCRRPARRRCLRGA